MLITESLRAALEFYAGKLRDDGNGYEFEKESITGSVAREALAKYPKKE